MLYPNIISKGGSLFFTIPIQKTKPRQQVRESSFIWNENTITCWQKFCHSRSRSLLFTVKNGIILRPKLSSPIAKYPLFFCNCYQRRIHNFSSSKYKDNHDRSSKCFKKQTAWYRILKISLKQYCWTQWCFIMFIYFFIE